LNIEVEGLDAVDGTHLLDIKPVWSGYSPRGTIREPEWARELTQQAAAPRPLGQFDWIK